MTRKQFQACDFFHRYEYLQEHGIKRAIFREEHYMVHLFAINDFTVALRMDHERFRITSLDIIDEHDDYYASYLGSSPVPLAS